MSTFPLLLPAVKEPDGHVCDWLTEYVPAPPVPVRKPVIFVPSVGPPTTNAPSEMLPVSTCSTVSVVPLMLPENTAG